MLHYEAREFLIKTDYKMTVDYFETLSTDEQIKIKAERENAREVIKQYESEIHTDNPDYIVDK